MIKLITILAVMLVCSGCRTAISTGWQFSSAPGSSISLSAFESWVKTNSVSGVMRLSCKELNTVWVREYKDGSPHGETTAWLNSKLVSHESYRNGKLHGTSEDYYDNGNICERANYKDGVLNGDYSYWHINGMLMSKGCYLDGEKNGEWLVLVADGCPYRLNVYVHGKLISGAIGNKSTSKE